MYAIQLIIVPNAIVVANVFVGLVSNYGIS